MKHKTVTAAEKLDSARSSVKKEKSMVTMVGLYAAVKDATNDLILNKESRVQPTILADSWLQHFSNGLVKSTGPGHHGVDIDRFFGIILAHNLVKSIVKDAEQARVMACVCMVRVLASTTMGHPAVHNVGHVMHAWFGRSIEHVQTMSLPAFVTCLYGPGVWELYGTDVSDIKHAPSHLYKFDLAIKGPAVLERDKATGAPVMLPYDM